MNGEKHLCVNCRWRLENGQCSHPERESDRTFYNVIEGTKCGVTRKQWEGKK